ncbi:hypothetical protein Gekk315_00040 [Aeromonas phage Gekk3-15]
MADIERPNYMNDPVPSQRRAMGIILIDPATGAPYKLVPQGPSAGVTSFNGRGGVVMPQSGDTRQLTLVQWQFQMMMAFAECWLALPWLRRKSSMI